MLNDLIEIAKSLYPVNEIVFVPAEILRQYGTKYGMWGRIKEDNTFVICIQEDLSDIEKIITLSHEIGHAADLANNYQSDLCLWDSISPFPRVIMLREQIAWLYSVRFLKRVGFSKWNYFLRTVSSSIGAYYQDTWDRYIQRALRCKKSGSVLRIKSKVEFLSELKSEILAQKTNQQPLGIWDAGFFK